MTKTEVTHLLWLDTETTGADHDKGDEIIEIGCVLTTTDLDVVDERSSIITPSATARARLESNDYVLDMHTGNGLLADLDALDEAIPASVVDSEFVDWLRTHGVVSHGVAIAGSGVGHFDRRFLHLQMSRLDKFCTYWPIDIGNLRRVYRFATGTDLAPGINDAKPHRALDDVRLHLEEARAFWSLFEHSNLSSKEVA